MSESHTRTRTHAHAHTHTRIAHLTVSLFLRRRDNVVNEDSDTIDWDEHPAPDSDSEDLVRDPRDKYVL
jgi:hypothetical protein